jgi:hypothetical protein
MTSYIPEFNPKQYELRNYTNPFLTPTQQADVLQAESRVQGQLDWLAQILGWNGPNYWGNLPSTVNQKRQLLGGSFGVYNSFYIPVINEIRNWENAVYIDKAHAAKVGQELAGKTAYLGYTPYVIEEVGENSESFILFFQNLDTPFYTEIQSGTPLKIDVASARPAPFYRPSIGIAGDASFQVAVSNGVLTLYPAYDSKHTVPYAAPVLLAGAKYYFNQDIYISFTSSLNPDITCEYDPVRELWFLEIPEDLSQTQLGLTAFLAWDYSDRVTPTTVSTTIQVQPWVDPSDWNSLNVLRNFLGAWGNKGGALPFNFTFDSLSIHGFNELNSLVLNPFSRSLDFNQIINFVYYQRVPTQSSYDPPGNPDYGDVFWNRLTGAFAVYYPQKEAEENCATWVEVEYREQPDAGITIDFIFPDVASFLAAPSALIQNKTLAILNATGLSASDNIIGLSAPLTQAASVVIAQETEDPYWTVVEVAFQTVFEFDQDALALPYQVKTTIFDGSGLAPLNPNSEISNLAIPVTEPYPVVLFKHFTDRSWEIVPDSLLKYIGETGLFGNLLDGEMWWDYANTLEETRAATVYISNPSPLTGVQILEGGTGLTDGLYTNVGVKNLTPAGGGNALVDLTVTGGIVTAVTIVNGGDFYQQGDIVRPDDPQFATVLLAVTSAVADNWVAINRHPQSTVPGLPVDPSVLIFYCDGNLLQAGAAYGTPDYRFVYDYDAVTGKYTFSYSPYTLLGRTQFPAITISDNITSAYTFDISEYVFSGVQYYMTPNVMDAMTPLRLWQPQALQVVETVGHLEQDTFLNPLRADVNTGPGPENWQRFFVRLPVDYARNGFEWQKSALICQDFAYYGSSIEPEKMECPPEESLPLIYEELCLYPGRIKDYTYIYSEPYLYSNVGATGFVTAEAYGNSDILPTIDAPFDDFSEGQLVDYEPLHCRQADTDSPVGQGYGDWLGIYVNSTPCAVFSGFLINDLADGVVEGIQAPVWDASIYKYAPTCQNAAASYSVDANNYKVNYAYFAADLSAAEDGFFDPQQQSAWRYKARNVMSSYVLPR